MTQPLMDDFTNPTAVSALKALDDLCAERDRLAVDHQLVQDAMSAAVGCYDCLACGSSYEFAEDSTLEEYAGLNRWLGRHFGVCDVNEPVAEESSMPGYVARGLSCTPSGCQCYCHQDITGMTTAHIVPCCNPRPGDPPTPPTPHEPQQQRTPWQRLTSRDDYPRFAPPEGSRITYLEAVNTELLRHKQIQAEQLDACRNRCDLYRATIAELRVQVQDAEHALELMAAERDALRAQNFWEAS